MLWNDGVVDAKFGNIFHVARYVIGIFHDKVRGSVNHHTSVMLDTKLQLVK